MSADTRSILCGDCRVPIEGPDDGKDDSEFVCPECGRSDTRKNVLHEVQNFVTDMAQRSFQESIKKAARGSKLLQFEGRRISKRKYRFVTELKL